MTRRARTRMDDPWGWAVRAPGRALRRMAAVGGDAINGTISGVSGVWALPKNRGTRKRGRTVRKVRRR